MLVLQENRKLFKLFFGNNYFYNVIYSSPMLCVFCLSAAYFVENISDINKSTQATYVIAAMSLYFSQYWVFAVQKGEYEDLMQGLQAIVEKSIYIGKVRKC